MAQLDSQKLEKLLISATNERQRKMYQSLLKKARSQEQASKKSDSATSNTAKTQTAPLQEQETTKASSATEKKVKAQVILGKVEKQEQVAIVSSSSPDQNHENLPKLELAPKPVLEKPPTQKSDSTNLLLLSIQEVTTQTNPSTSTLTAENNQKSAQNDSSNNQAPSPNKQAKSSKSQENKKKKKTQKKKVEAEAPIFQALVKMLLTPYLKGNNLKVEINGQEYNLLYGSDFTFIAHKKLRQELIENGSSKMLVKLYPNVQFSKQSETPKLSFILGSFEQKYQPNRKYSQKFRLRGIWQYIPQSQSPVISIYRNVDQLGQFKKLNEKQQSQFVRPNHIPVLWDDAPVAPFKYEAELEKEAQMPRYFVEVEAIIQDGLYVVQEMLREPTLDIPEFLQIAQNKASTSDNREISLRSDPSLSNSEKFQFVLRGEVRNENDFQFFQLENGTKFKVRAIIADSYPLEITDWQVVPITDNDGQLVTLILEKPLSSSEVRTTPSNFLIEAGRIVEVAKKGNRIKVKVKRETAKDLKVGVLGATKKMKMGQLWAMKLVLKEGYLYIEQAQYLQD